MSIAYSVTTGHYTVEQLEGEACANCGETFQPGQTLEQVFASDDYDLFAHTVCPNGGTTR